MFDTAVSHKAIQQQSKMNAQFFILIVSMGMAYKWSASGRKQSNKNLPVSNLRHNTALLQLVFTTDYTVVYGNWAD
jgi:hypothetical protein